VFFRGFRGKKRVFLSVFFCVLLWQKSLSVFSWRTPENRMTFKANDSLTEQIAQHLGKKIIEGEMLPGERVQELRDAAELSVSSGSIREALLILQRRHLVEIFPRRGAVVASIGRADVRDFFELWFWLLERVFVELAEQRRAEDLALLDTALAELERCRQQDDIQGFYETGVALLRQLFENTPNRYLQATLDDLLPLSQRCLYVILRAGHGHMLRTLGLLQELTRRVQGGDLAEVRVAVAEFARVYSELAQAAAAVLEGGR
jgi:DNA-binding GntR family transcriptional regulator